MKNVVNIDFDSRNPMANPSPTGVSGCLDSFFASDDYAVLERPSPDDSPRTIVYEHEGSGVRVNYTSSFSGFHANLSVDISEEHGSSETRRSVESEIKNALNGVL